MLYLDGNVRFFIAIRQLHLPAGPQGFLDQMNA